MKLFTITAIPLVSALVLGGAFVVPRDDHTVTTKHDNATEGNAKNLRLIVDWQSRSFDEAVWLAVDRIATLEENLPEQVENFQVEMQPAGDTQIAVQLAFSRSDLAALKAGDLSPEDFIREHVRFE